MKNLLSIFALLLFAGIGCNKSNQIQTPVSSSDTTLDAYPNVVGVVDRDGNCCCSLVVSSTYFGGLTICGVTSEGTTDCHFCTEQCGSNCGGMKTVPQNKNSTFCITSGCPFKITNTGNRRIQIYFICPGGTSSPVWIDPLASVIYSNDCSGTTTTCTEVPCGG